MTREIEQKHLKMFKQVEYRIKMQILQQIILEIQPRIPYTRLLQTLFYVGLINFLSHAYMFRINHISEHGYQLQRSNFI